MTRSEGETEVIIYKHIDQGTPEWKKLRAGKVTGSMVHNIMKNGRGGKPSLSTQSYMMQLLAERLTGEPIETFKSKAMEWGNQWESSACSRYEWESGNVVDHVAFCELSEWVGYSPDGLIGDDGLLEIKCPETPTQLKRFYKVEEIPAEYYAQMQFGMMVTGRAWCDFVSYDPRLNNTNAEILIERVERDEKYIIDMQNRIDSFVSAMIDRVRLAQQQDG